MQTAPLMLLQQQTHGVPMRCSTPLHTAFKIETVLRLYFVKPPGVNFVTPRTALTLSFDKSLQGHKKNKKS